MFVVASIIYICVINYVAVTCTFYTFISFLKPFTVASSLVKFLMHFSWFASHCNSDLFASSRCNFVCHCPVSFSTKFCHCPVLLFPLSQLNMVELVMDVLLFIFLNFVSCDYRRQNVNKNICWSSS